MADLQDDTKGLEAVVLAGAVATSIDDRNLCYTLEEDAEKIPVVLLNDGQSVEVLDEVVAALEKRRPGPRRRTGIAALTERDGFIEHVNRFKSPASVVFADVARFSLQAVYNYHPAGPAHDKAAWCDHGAVYTCPRSPAWIAWTQFDGQMMAQEPFAQLIEQRFEDITSGGDSEHFPSAASMLEMARDLQINVKGRFEKKIDPRTGSNTLVAKEETETVGSTYIPRAFLLGIAVFDGGELYKVEARLRVKIENGQPKLGYQLHRRTEIERDAFGDVRKAVIEKCAVPVLAGAPER